MARLLRMLRITPCAAAQQAEERIRKADASIVNTVARKKAPKAHATATTCALLLMLAAPGCAQVKGWLAGGPEIELSIGLGPAKLGLVLNPGKTVVDAATALANAGESLAGVTGAIDAVPAE